jgi:hypothetical protein
MHVCLTDVSHAGIKHVLDAGVHAMLCDLYSMCVSQWLAGWLGSCLVAADSMDLVVFECVLCMPGSMLLALHSGACVVLPQREPEASQPFAVIL